ncbi:MAG: hypothetical protein HF975_04470 [ANME-2 cluster archaeon]|nr:hypothetical protein [ANME-2 cluster archaeon]
MALYQDMVEQTVTLTPTTPTTSETAIAITATVLATPSIPSTSEIAAPVTATVTATPEAAPVQILAETVEDTVTVSTQLPHTYIFADIDYFKIESWSVSKNINDTLWRFSGRIDQHDVPSYFKNLLVKMTGLDRASPPAEKDYVIFLGFIPGANYVYQAANNKSDISGYDHGWYLSSQAILESLTVTTDTVNPATTLKTMLGDAGSLEETGLDILLGNIIDVASWPNIQKSFLWKFDTKKRKAIDELVNYTGSIFAVKPVKSIGNAYYPGVYFVSDIDHATDGLDLPALATFSNPDPYLVDISMEVNEAEAINRVTIHGTNRETGLWKSKTEESAAVTSGDTIPRELVIANYVPEPPPADAAALQTAVDAKAAELYALFYTNATTRIIKATLKRRADLELWQQVGFVGYSGIPGYSAPSTNIMRIVDITYRRSLNQDIVEISCILTKDLSNETARRMALGADDISGQQDLMSDLLQGLGENEVGEVTAITGSVATITLEKDGKSVEARILNPV